ncbi:uncharacterized protein LOC118203130 [Stegodyphus dumicola]|uniref:uncharacterized protein LOC118203130 n=1 Tax=Stegodyphus dumicola TaxID=202533 RepID=UPI0015A933B6|nr:uncharacterized protein LOC118203130 [Stegodyphus dumicola]
MAPILQDWTVVENLSISDHNYIRFNLANSTATSILKRYNLPGRKVRAFTAIIRARLAPFATAIRQANSKEALQNLIQDILTAIQKACDENLPLLTAKRITTLNWWNGTLRSQQQRRRLKQERRHNLETSTLLLYQRERALYKRMILEAKISSWRKFCTETTTTFGIHHKIAAGKLFKPATLYLQPTPNTNDHLTESTLSEILRTVFTKDNPTGRHSLSYHRPKPAS